jgi:tRNA nucleotidyltransferase (CCA-adding enzyme)
MEIYLVGGAVRDELLGRPVRERDWVVVGSTPDEMLALGYRQVGRDFPVFLHAETSEEYALARTERKTGPGHTGFVCHAGPDVTLEEDLARRDLTVNAMARAPDGVLVDPFGGRADLQAHLLRHVSAAFAEDPLRVFRVARFAAQLPGFTVAPETLALMRRMADDGLLAELSAERVWQELHKALSCAEPARFFDVLAAARATRPWLLELDGVDTGLLGAVTDPETRFGMLAWMLDRDRARSLCTRLKSPRRFQRVAEQVAEHGRTLADWQTVDSEALVGALNAIGALAGHRDPQPVLAAAAMCAGVSLQPLQALIAALRDVTAAAFRGAGLEGPALGAAIAAARAAITRDAQRAAPPRP